MKKIKLFLLAAPLLFAIDSCTKKTEACIDGPEQVEEYTSATYTWCGSNADNIEWSINGIGVLGTGNSFTPTFPAKGKYTLVAKGSNKKYEKTATFNVSYGRYPNTVALLVSTACFNLPANDANLSKYIAYLYNSKSDWSADVAAKNHAHAQDSATCGFDDIWKTPFFTFKKIYAVGDKKIVSVEYKGATNAGEAVSNWAEVATDRATVEIKFNGFSENNNNNSGTTALDKRSKDFILMLATRKWKLVSISANPPEACKADDFMTFSADGSWKYEAGTDDCGGTVKTSQGTYKLFNDFCYTGSWFENSGFTSAPGSTFKVQGMDFNDSQDELRVYIGNNTYYNFKPM